MASSVPVDLWRCLRLRPAAPLICFSLSDPWPPGSLGTGWEWLRALALNQTLYLPRAGPQPKAHSHLAGIATSGNYARFLLFIIVCFAIHKWRLMVKARKSRPGDGPQSLLCSGGKCPHYAVSCRAKCAKMYFQPLQFFCLTNDPLLNRFQADSDVAVIFFSCSHSGSNKEWHYLGQWPLLKLLPILVLLKSASVPVYLPYLISVSLPWYVHLLAHLL